MWLSPLKGAHLTLGQLDKTLPVDMSNVATTKNNTIERGSIVFIHADNNGKGYKSFQLYTGTQAGLANAVPYIALVGVADFQAGMAGNEVQAPETIGIDKASPATGDTQTWLRTPPPKSSGIVGVSGVRGPRITAISLVQPAEWQTTAFDKGAGVVDKYYVGCPLTVNDDGVVTPWETGKNIVGYVTAIPKKRWINDLGASENTARISGGSALVIEFSTAWIPVAGKAAAADSAPTLGVVGAMGVKGGAPAGAQAADAKATDGAKANDGAKADNKTK